MDCERRVRHRRWLEGFGFTARDWARIKGLAETPTDAVGQGLDDLDAPYRVVACAPGWERRFSGVLLGSWHVQALLAWPLSERERALWARRRAAKARP